MYCFDTAEKNDEVIYCDPGEVAIFSVDVMTSDQWSAMFSDDYEMTPFDMGYNVMIDQGNIYYVFSHPNGFLPDDAPIGDEFYNSVMSSIEFVK